MKHSSMVSAMEALMHKGCKRTFEERRITMFDSEMEKEGLEE